MTGEEKAGNGWNRNVFIVRCLCAILGGKRKGQLETGLFQSEPEIKMQKREEYHPILSGKLSSYFLSSSFFF